MDSPANNLSNVTVSAPGKVLLAGGYLVLEAPNSGFVIAADKRFYTSISGSGTAGVDIKNKDNKKPICLSVKSPQFHSEWNYTFNKSNYCLVPSPSNESVNPFIEKTLRVCLIYILESSSSAANTTSLNVIIRADNDFYSILPHLPPNSDKTPAVVAALPKFLPCPVDPDSGKVVVHKTGLGSSAALTTSLVGALVHYFRCESQEGQKSGIIHNLAQICHCHAQGKVGSGFDVSAACHGTHVYRRFPKCLLPDLLVQLEQFEKGINSETENANSKRALLCKTLKDSVDLNPWKEDMVTPLNLPNDLQLLLADVRGGSESPSMARTVLKWRAKNTNGIGEVPHWSTLSELNPKIIESIQLLSKEAKDSIDYGSLSKLPASEWPSDNNSPLITLRDTFSQIRNELRLMGEAADVPIEPPPQQELCDATSKLPGVVTALVPGAGGYDAVACLYINRPEVIKSIGELWASWTSPVVCPLAVRADDEGLRLENILENVDHNTKKQKL